MAQNTLERSRLDGVLSVIERAGNRIPHPFVLFAWLLLIIAVVTTLLDLGGVSARVPGEDQPVPVHGLLTSSGLTWFLTSFVENLMLFPPLGNVVVMLLAIGVAERTGLLKAAVTALFSRAPAWLLPYVAAFVAAQGHVMSDPSMIVIPPLAALVFLAAGRHPLAGMLGAFACTTAGYASGILIGSLDALLSGITAEAVQVVDTLPTTQVTVARNWYFAAVSGLVLPLIGGYLIDRVLEPRLGTYTGPGAGEDAEMTPAERTGLRVTGVFSVAFIAVVAVGFLMPGSPLQGGLAVVATRKRCRRTSRSRPRWWR